MKGTRSSCLVLLMCGTLGCGGAEDGLAPATGGTASGESGASGSGGSNTVGHPSGGSGAAKAGSGGSAGRAGSGSGGESAAGNAAEGPVAGNPDGHCDVPAEAGAVDTSRPHRVVGTGTAASCTAEAFIAAVAAGGIIAFDCGEEPVTIPLNEPAKVFNDASDRVVIDGGGRVTLSGQGRTRILYMNTCDEAQHWTTDHCDDQPFPELTLQNLTFVDGNATAEGEGLEGGGGAVWARGGRLKLVNTRFFNNVCAPTGADVGGAAVRAFSQFGGQPVYVVNSTFGGAEGFGNQCSNGGGIASIGVSWSIFNSVFSYNRALGNGGNPAAAGTPGGGSGGAIYNDGNTMTLSLCGSLLEHNQVNAYGSAIFFVSNDHTGTLSIHDSVVRHNTGGEWNVLPSISMHDDTTRDIRNSTIE